MSTIYRFKRAELDSLSESAASLAVAAVGPDGDLTVDTRTRAAAEAAIDRLATNLAFTTNRTYHDAVVHAMKANPNLAKLSRAEFTRLGGAAVVAA